MAEENIIKVLFGVDGSSLDKGLNAATGRIAKFSNEINKKLVITAGELARSIKTIAGAIPNALLNSAKSIGDLYDKSQNLRIVVARFQELDFAASKAGVSAESLGTTFAILKQRIGAGFGGDTGVTEALKKININLKDLQGIPVDEQFKRIARGLKEISDPNIQADLSNAFFGKGGKDLIGLINSDLDSTIEKYKKLGLAISETDAEAADSFDESAAALGKVFDGFLLKVTAYAAPALDSMLTKLTDMITKSGGLDVVAKKVADKIVSWSTNMITFIGHLGTASTKMGELITKTTTKGDVNGNNAFYRPLTTWASGIYEGGKVIYDGIADGVNVAKNSRVGRMLGANSLANNSNLYPGMAAQTAGNFGRSPYTGSTSVAPVQVIDVQAESLKRLTKVVDEAKVSLEKFKVQADGSTSVFSQVGRIGGNEQIDRILNLSTESSRPIAIDEDFDRTAADIVDKIIGGVSPTSADIQSPLAFLQNQASITYDGQNHGAQKQALLEIYKLIEDKKPQQVDINLKVVPTPYAFIEWANDPKSKKTIFGATESETAALASAVAGRT